jgi:hypothetical protein
VTANDCIVRESGRQDYRATHSPSSPRGVIRGVDRNLIL